MEKVVILGAGGHAREVLWAFEEDNRATPKWEVLGFIDENTSNTGRKISDLPILGDFKWFDKEDRYDIYVISGAGNCQTKLRFAEKAAAVGLRFCSVIDSSVNAPIGRC